MLDISDFPWADIAEIERDLAYSATTVGLKDIYYFKNAHRIELELTTYAMNAEEGRSIKARLAPGKRAGFIYVHPRWSFSKGTVPNSKITVNNNFSAGANFIAFTCSDAWQLKAGDIFTVAGHKKVYSVAADTQLINGTQIITLAYPLLHDINSGVEVTVNNVTYSLKSISQIETQSSASDSELTELSMIFVEDF